MEKVENKSKKDPKNDAVVAAMAGGASSPSPNPSPSTALTPPPETQALDVFDYGEDAGQGFENQDMSDRKLPLIELLQSNSPDVLASKGALRAGQFRNTVTGEVYDEVYFVPAVTDHCFTEWLPRDDGGGFRGRHPKGSPIVAAAIARNGGRAIGKLPVPQPDKDGKPQPAHELVESFEIYAICYDPKTGDSLGFVMIPFTSTKIKVYRDWNSAITLFSPVINGKKVPQGQIPMFAHRVKMTSDLENRNSYSYMVPVLAPAQGGDELLKSIIGKNDPRYVEAKKLHDDVLKGLAKAAYETGKQDAGVDPESGVPF